VFDVKQIIQNISNGKTLLVEVPAPKCKNGSLLIATRNSLVSSGTERMLVDFGKANYINKIRQQPDKVKLVLDKVKADGLVSTFDAVQSKLDQPIPLGYCNVGVILESHVNGFSIGDRVISNGPHAELVHVKQNLCAKIPDNVDDDSASFVILAAIALQGIRLINPTLGETVVVSGLGLVGLLAVQILQANGCRVLAVDFDSTRCELARSFGAEVIDLSKGVDLINSAHSFSRGRGVDAVLIAASTKSDEVIHHAAVMCRKRGRVVLVGVVGLNLRRDDFFKKEITFQVSSSYGPGRYDEDYEDKGQDYPFGFVRWTEQRNFEAVLDMMASSRLNVKSLITHRYDFESAVEAYDLLNNPAALGILLEYSVKDVSYLKDQVIQLRGRKFNDLVPINPVVGFIGAGNYASRTLIPAFSEVDTKLDTLVTNGSVSSIHHGRKAGFKVVTTSLDVLWKSVDINLVVIVTRHHSHATQVELALGAGKNVFVEKPLALKLDELDGIDKTFQRVNESRTSPVRLMIGFNRRFAPHIVKMKSLLEGKNEPKIIIITVNAGEVPAEHWTQDPEIGGGRIVGEGCHFIDLMRFLVGKSIVNHQAMLIGDSCKNGIIDDKVSINLSFSDGSFGTIHYLANGGKVFPKERLEVFCENAVLQLDNYRVLKGFGWKGFNKMKLFKQDKGQKACAKAFVDAIRNGKPAPIPYDELMESSRISIEVAESLKKNL